MVRAFVILLFMIIFFLSGAVYGMKETKDVQENQLAEENTTGISEHAELKETEPVSNIPEEDIDRLFPSEPTLTEKTASALEAGVQGFYEAVVNVLYGIAKLFF